MQPYTFSFNDINSSVYGLEYDTLTDELVPNRRNDRSHVDYRHGTHTSNSGMREDRVVSFRATWRSDKPLDRYMLREISYWLKDFGKLTFDIEPDKYYKARMDSASQIALARLMDKADGLMRSGSIFLQFVCESFAYSEQTKLKLVAGRNEINYNGTEKGYPIISIANHTSSPMPVGGFRISIHRRSHSKHVLLSGLIPSAVNIQRYNFMRFNIIHDVEDYQPEQTEEDNAIEIDLALGVGETVVIDNAEETVTLIRADTTRQNIRHLLSLLYDEYLTLNRASAFIDIQQTQAHDVQVEIKISELWL